jgi:inorganic pyrophosphatase
VPIVPKAVIRARPIGVLLTEDEKGNDSKIIATALNDVDPSFSQVSDVEDIPDHVRNQITHFFEHYKELEEGKYVRIVGWKDREFAKEKIVKAMNIYRGLGQSN